MTYMGLHENILERAPLQGNHHILGSLTSKSSKTPDLDMKSQTSALEAVTHSYSLSVLFSVVLQRILCVCLHKLYTLAVTCVTSGNP